jgi:1-phosphatidylinositol phosphodiesterase
MSPLDGKLGLWELTIPGTHDSCSRHGGASKQTQTLDIAGQLAAGIRFFDIRLEDDAGVFRVFHDEVDQHLELEADVLAPMRDFLAGHPGETLIMSAKREGSEGDDATFARDFEALAARRPGDFRPGADFPVLEAARGKIVLIRRYAGGSAGIAAEPAGWANNATFAIATDSEALEVEDQWDLGLSLTPHRAKWRSVAEHLDAAASSASGWYITFTSAVHDVLTPRLIAGGAPGIDGINQRLLDYLAGHPGHRRLGIVAMDFPELPDGRLLQGLIDTNI